MYNCNKKHKFKTAIKDENSSVSKTTLSQTYQVQNNLVETTKHYIFAYREWKYEIFQVRSDKNKNYERPAESVTGNRISNNKFLKYIT